MVLKPSLEQRRPRIDEQASLRCCRENLVAPNIHRSQKAGRIEGKSRVVDATLQRRSGSTCGPKLSRSKVRRRKGPSDAHATRILASAAPARSACETEDTLPKTKAASR